MSREHQSVLRDRQDVLRICSSWPSTGAAQPGKPRVAPGAQAAGGATLVAAVIPRSPVPDVGIAEGKVVMPYVPTGVGAFGVSLSWEKVDGDKDVARRVITYLEDRRLLFGERHTDDRMHCVHSAISIRNFLTEELTNAKPGKSLEASLRVIRAACRDFVEAAGPNGRNFGYQDGPQTDRFSLALGKLHSLVGLHLAVIANQYGLEVEDDLAQILPPDVSADNDPSIIPGWEDPL